MTCKYCSAAFPPDALFCGECGRAVSNLSSRAKRTELPPLSTEAAQPELLIDAPLSAVCEQCGSSVMPDDIFCEECGFVVDFVASSRPQPRDTNVIERLEPIDVDGSESGIPPLILPEPTTRMPELKPEPEPEPEPELPISAPSSAAPRGVEEFAEDLESTRIVARPQNGERFVLQFSTGESFTVYGSGLIGRNPKPEPGEYFDQMVRIIDAGRSVSKTHLEFGQEAGCFWVKDRFSGNGTIIREPDVSPLRCRPERRYRLIRGSRVDLGEQFFIVS